MKKIFIEDNEELIITPRSKKFLLGCCDCGLTHLITIRRKNGEIRLRFKKVVK